MAIERGMSKRNKSVKEEEIDIDAEKECYEECSEIENNLKSLISERKKRYQESYNQKVDTGYYFTVVFQTRKDCEDFLEKSGFERDTLFCDGYALSERFKLDIIPQKIKYIYRKSKQWLDIK